MVKTPKVDLRSADGCCPPESTANKDRGGWLVALPIIGVLFCCGGPVIGGWLAAAGLLAVLGSWWAGAGHWIVIALAVAVAAGVGWWLRARRVPRSPGIRE